MNEQLDKQLCEKFPYMFQRRHGLPSETNMCWGFTCGDGWYNIINALCVAIEHHIKWKRESRVRAMLYNRRLKKAIKLNDCYFLLPNWVSSNVPAPDWAINEARAAMTDRSFKEVPEKIQRVIVDQVKEKFGGMRFNYDGGDDYIAGLVQMAETMSQVTCEKCGNIGKTSHFSGLLATLCETHAAELIEKQSKEEY